MNGWWAVARRIFIRELLTGQLNTLIGALVLAVSAMTTTGILADRLDRTVGQEAGEILGADLVIRGRSQAPDHWRAQADHLGLKHIESIEFSSMLVESDGILLVGVKAVEEGYPLRGELSTEDDSGVIKASHEIPPPGEAWVDSGVLRRLDLKLGAHVSVGEKSLQITRILTHEPDRRGDMSGLSPRVLINRVDLDATKVIQPGSQITHVELLKGDPDRLRAFRTIIKPQLQPDQKLNDLEEDRPELGKTLQRTRQFMSFLSLSVILLAGVAIALSAQDYVRRHTAIVALLRCLGSPDHHIMAVLLAQILSIGLLGSLTGVLIGTLVETSLLTALGDLLPSHIAVPRIGAWLLSIGLGNALLMVFAVPPVLDLRNMPILGILQNAHPPPASRRLIAYSIGIFLILLTLLWHTGNAKVMLVTLGIGAGALAILSLGAFLILWGFRKASSPLPFPVRLGIRRLFRHPSRTLIQITGFSLTFAALTLVTTLRGDLIDDWISHLPAAAPNYFVINLFDRDLPEFEATVQREAPQRLELYPVIRGRLTQINHEDALKVASLDSRAESAINRDLALTFSATLPPDNRVIEGMWDPLGKPDDLSIEEGLAKRLRAKLGDVLEFNILGERMSARVGSIRTVHWDRMTPNFFFIFPKNLLEHYPRTWMTSLFLGQDHVGLERTLVHQFPSISLIEIGRLVDQLRKIINQISQAVLPLISLCLISGFFALLAGVHATSHDRRQEDRLLRIIGAGSNRIRLTNATEFLALGLISGFYGAVVAESIRWTLYHNVLEIPFQLRYDLLIGAPHGGALVLTIVGLWSSRKKD